MVSFRTVSRILMVAFVALVVMGAATWLTAAVSALALIAIALWIREDRREQGAR